MWKDYSNYKQDAKIANIMNDFQKVPMTPAEEFQAEFYRQLFVEGEVSYPNKRLTKIAAKVIAEL